MKLGGVHFWVLEFDDFRGLCGNGTFPLLRAVNAVLRDRTVLDVDLLPVDIHIVIIFILLIYIVLSFLIGLVFSKRSNNGILYESVVERK